MEISLILLWFCASVATSKLVYSVNTTDVNENAPKSLQSLDQRPTNDIFEDLLKQLRSKRATQRRCGKKLLMDMVKICNGCVGKPEKRHIHLKKRSPSLTEECCEQGCTEEDLKTFCC